MSDNTTYNLIEVEIRLKVKPRVCRASIEARQLSGTATTGKKLGHPAGQHLGSVAGGSKLRIVFPLVVNEELTPAELPFVPPIIGERGSLIKNPPPLPKQLYPTDIAPATTEYFGIGEDLSNFQVLSGDPSALTPNKFWSWNGLSNVTVLAQDLVAADAEQKQLFWSGILIGVAGGGAIAFALELIGLGEEVSKRRKDADEATQKATLAAPQ